MDTFITSTSSGLLGFSLRLLNACLTQFNILIHKGTFHYLLLIETEYGQVPSHCPEFSGRLEQPGGANWLTSCLSLRLQPALEEGGKDRVLGISLAPLAF